MPNDLPPLPEPQIVGLDGIGFSYAQVREVQAIARQQGRDEMREWKASRVRDEALSEAVGLYESEDVLAPVGNSAWGEAYQEGWISGAQAYREAIRSLIGTPKSAEGEGA